MINGAHVLRYSADAEADRNFFRDVLGLKSVSAAGMIEENPFFAGQALSRAILFDPRLPMGISGIGSEGKRAANTISQVRGVSLSPSGVGVVVSK